MGFVELTVPGEPPKRRARRLVVGIDLGTTNSLVATVSDGKPVVIAGPGNRRILPSVVDYKEGKVVAVGSPPRAELADGASRVMSAKRCLGLGVGEVDGLAGLRSLPAPEEGDEKGPARIKLGDGHEVSPVAVAAELLAELGRWAQDHLGGHLSGAVITVPAYFDDAQRQATKDAAKIAGLEVLRLLNEPTAAALAYGLDNAEEGTYVVYDMGGGTFDVSVLRLSKGLFQVVATDGDTRLGGDDFDAILAKLASEQLAGPAGVDERELLLAARQAKERLSTEAESPIEVGGQEITVDRGQLARASSSLLERSKEILLSCLRRSGVAEEVKAVIMVGGATRMPHLRSMVEEAVDAPMHTDLDPDEVVALGAAAQADILAGNRPADDWLLLDVNPLSLGIETMGGLVERIIPRNSPIPIARAQEFTTHKDGQGAMSIHVVQGERDQVADCRSLARFSLKGIPPMAAGTARVLVTYRLDADGLLSVEAQETQTGTNAQIEVKPAYGLSEGEVAEMLVDARMHAKEDAVGRVLAEAKVAAASLLDTLETAVGQDAKLLEGDRPAIEQAMQGLRRAMEGDSADAIVAATGALDKASEGFAARRMEGAMRRALAGKSVDEL